MNEEDLFRIAIPASENKTVYETNLDKLKGPFAERKARLVKLL